MLYINIYIYIFNVSSLQSRTALIVTVAECLHDLETFGSEIFVSPQARNLSHPMLFDVTRTPQHTGRRYVAECLQQQTSFSASVVSFKISLGRQFARRLAAWFGF